MPHFVYPFIIGPMVYNASLEVQSGNGLFLKGGKEAMRSNAILHNV